MGFIAVECLLDPRLDCYRDLPNAKVSQESDDFIAESRTVVKRLLKTALEIKSIVCSEKSQHELTDVATRRPEIPIFVVPYQRLKDLIGFKLHRGMLACARRPKFPSVASLVKTAAPTNTIVICPQIADPVNLAGVIRNCAAFGVGGLIIGAQSCVPYSRRVVRVSMGTIFHLPVRVTDDLTTDLRTLHRDFRYTTVGTVLAADAISIVTAERPCRLALLFGSEKDGIDEQWMSLCDQKVTLPMRQGTDSLNVATATGVFLYHYTHVAQNVPASD